MMSLGVSGDHYAVRSVSVTSAIDRWPLRGPGECVAWESIERWPLRGRVACASIGGRYAAATATVDACYR